MKIKWVSVCGLLEAITPWKPEDFQKQQHYWINMTLHKRLGLNKKLYHKPQYTTTVYIQHPESLSEPPSCPIARMGRQLLLEGRN